MRLRTIISAVALALAAAVVLVMMLAGGAGASGAGAREAELPPLTGGESARGIADGGNRAVVVPSESPVWRGRCSASQLTVTPVFQSPNPSALATVFWSAEFDLRNHGRACTFIRPSRVRVTTASGYRVTVALLNRRAYSFRLRRGAARYIAFNDTWPTQVRRANGTVIKRFSRPCRHVARQVTNVALFDGRIEASLPLEQPLAKVCGSPAYDDIEVTTKRG